MAAMTTRWTHRRVSRRALVSGLAGVAGVGLLLGACGQGQPAGTSQPAATKEGGAAPATTAPQGQRKELHLVFAGWIVDQNPVVNELAETYGQEHGITVTITSAPQDIQQKLLLEARQQRSTWGGYEGHTAFLNTAPLTEANVIDSWDPYLTKEDLDDLWPSGQKEMEYEGKKWHFPFRVSPMMIIYRPSVLEKLGYEQLPDTWDGIIELCEKATKDLSTADKKMYGITFHTEAWRGLWTVMSTLTAEPYDYDEGISRLDIPEAAKGLEIIKQLYAYAPPDTHSNPDTLTNVFQAGQSALMLAWVLQAQRVKPALNGDVKIGKLPRTGTVQGTVFWSSGPNILKHYGASEEAAGFWLWLSKQRKLYESMWVKNGSPPNRHSLFQEFESMKGKELDEGFWLANEVQEGSKAIPNSLWIPIQAKHIKAQTDALLGGQVETPEQALEIITKETETEIAKQKA